MNRKILGVFAKLLIGTTILLYSNFSFLSAARKSSINLIEKAFVNGEISYENSLIYKLQFVFNYISLPKEFQSNVIEESGTSILKEVLINWNTFSPNNKEIVKKYIRLNSANGEITLLSEPVLDLTYLYGHFSIEYTTIGIHGVSPVDNDGTGVPDYVEIIAKRFEDNTWKHEIVTLGYPSLPIPYKVKIFNVRIENPGINGYELPHNVYSKTSTSHIAMYNNLDLAIKPAKDGGIATDAHEFFHAIQDYNYINYGQLDHLGNPVDPDWKIGRWWSEASATWMSDEVTQYDGINWYQYAYLNPTYYNWFDYPENSLNYDSMTAHPYGSSIFCKYLTERQIGSWTAGSIKDIWTACATESTALKAIDKVLVSKGTSLESEFPKFTICNTITLESSTTMFVDPQYRYSDDVSTEYPAIKIADIYSGDLEKNGGGGSSDKFSDGSEIKLANLSSHYIKFIQPSLVNKPTNVVLGFKAGSPGSWGIKVVAIQQNNQKVVYDFSTQSVFSIGITRTNPQSTEIKEIYLIPSNLLTRETSKTYSFSAKYVPQFRIIYDTTPANGTTNTVKNLDTTNTYWNNWINNTLHLEVTLSDTVDDVRVDFSGIDNGSDKGIFAKTSQVTPQGIVWSITHTLSENNTFTGTGSVKITSVKKISRIEYINEENFQATIKTCPWTFYYSGNKVFEDAGFTYTGNIRASVVKQDITTVKGINTVSTTESDPIKNWSFYWKDDNLATLPLTLEWSLKYIQGIYGGMADYSVSNPIPDINVHAPIYIYPNRVELNFNNWYPTQTYYMNTTDGFHIYRITVEANKWITLYIDGIQRLSGSGAGNWYYDALWAAISTGGYAQTKISYDYIAYYIGAAYPPEAFPNTAGLLATSKFAPDITFKQGEVYSYPNPAKNGKTPKIHIECGIADKVNFDIYDTAGQIVHSTEMIGMPNVIWENKYAYEYAWDISNIASGVYVYIVKALKEGAKEIKAIGKIGIIK